MYDFPVSHAESADFLLYLHYVEVPMVLHLGRVHTSGFLSLEAF